MAQDNELKKPFQMGTPENAAGSESPQTTLISSSTTVDLDASYGLNIAASGENRSAKFKAPNVSQDQGEGANQY